MQVVLTLRNLQLTVLAIISQNNYTTKCHLHKQYFDACVPEAGIDRYNKNGRAALRKEAARPFFVISINSRFWDASIEILLVDTAFYGIIIL